MKDNHPGAPPSAGNGPASAPAAGPELPLHGELGRLYEKTLACVHCGLCLPACPAYGEAPRESLAPRGQVYIARAVLEGRLEAAPGIADDLYECLACRGCETVCPAGVEVGTIVEGVRGLLDEKRVEPRWTRFARRLALGGVVARPRMLRVAMAAMRLGTRPGVRRLVRPLLRRLAPGLASREKLLPEVPPAERLPRRFRPAALRGAARRSCSSGAWRRTCGPRRPGRPVKRWRATAGRWKSLRRSAAAGRSTSTPGSAIRLSGWPGATWRPSPRAARW